MKIDKYSSIDNCLEEWDELACTYFQKKAFLRHCEQFNPCQQRYYVLESDGRPKACAIVYTLQVDLFTFLNIPSPIKINVVGVPCSVSSAGIFGDSYYISILLQYIEKKEKGLSLCLNLEENIAAGNWAIGRTLPSIVFNKDINNWNSYLSLLTSDYRRRCRNIITKFRQVAISRLPCQEFNLEMYRQYLAVHNKSSAKLEKLSFEFFQNLNRDFNLTTYQHNKALLGWHISLSDKNRFYFLFGGINYETNDDYLSYFNMLFDLLRRALDEGKTYIDFGQTAEVPKIRLGGQAVEKQMMAFHHNSFITRLLKAGKGLLEYKTITPASHVFRR